jgi:hypothetical protein
MDAPRCKICKDRHYGLCSNTSLGSASGCPEGDDGRTEVNRLRKRNVTESETTAGAILKASGDKSQVVTAGETAQKFDRLAYQREYMRKRRAAKKALGEAQ